MKKALAVLLCLAMLFTALTVNVFAETTTPAVDVITNTAELDGTATFAVKLSGFTTENPLAGVDLTVTVPSATKMELVTVKNFDKDTFVENEDYTVSNTELHIVGLTSDKAKNTIVTVKATLSDASVESAVSVTASLAKNGTSLHQNATINANPIVGYTAKPAAEPETAGSDAVAQPTDQNKFIPYGAVYVSDGNGGYTYRKKLPTGVFESSNGDSYKEFTKPAGKFGTFDATGAKVKINETEYDAIQFGNYAENYDPQNYDYGTMVISGDWNAFKNWWLGNYGISANELTELIYNAYNKAMENNKYNYILFENGGVTIGVKTYAQTKYMWKNSDGNVLEYAIRIYDLENTTYNAVAYKVKTEDGTVTMSTVIESETYTKA